MPIRGGASDKFGNRYELWWTVLQLVKILKGAAESIRIEDPGVIKAEFALSRNGCRELHQAKRSNPSGKWSLSSLADPGMQVLQAMQTQLVDTHSKFVFVSGSDARELAELAERSRDAATFEEFQLRFIDGKEQQANFEKLKTYWHNVESETAFEILQRIEVRTIDEQSIEDQVNLGLQALFLISPASVANALRCLAEDSIHKTITRDFLIEYLNKSGFQLRRILRLEDSEPLIREVTDKYLTPIRKKLIQNTLIQRASTQALITQIDGQIHGVETILTGKAGSGKTGCIIEFVDTLRNRPEPPVDLAFRLDRITPVTTTVELGEQLGIEESPVLVLAAAAKATGRNALLVIDQVDAVSTAAGRSSDFLEVVEALLCEARAFRDTIKLDVVVVCRAFDWKNDHRLRRLFPESHTVVEAVNFSLEEVKRMLSEAGFNSGIFHERQLELLQLPQNLSLFLDADFELTKELSFYTAKDLFDRYWKVKRTEVAKRASPHADQWSEVIDILCEEMTRTQQLSVPREKLDRILPEYLDQIASEGVLIFDGRRYGFGHESFFDYCFARGFVSKNQPLVDFLTASEQHLFRRAQVRQVLAYLRDADRTRYCHELLGLITDVRIRTHIKDLAIAVSVNMPDPGDEEWAMFAPFIDLEQLCMADAQQNSDQLAGLVWQHFFTSVAWFHTADRRGLIAAWLQSSNENVVDRTINYLRFHQRHAGDRVAEILSPYVGSGEWWNKRLKYLMEWADLQNSRKSFELFLILIDDGTLDEAKGPIAINSTFWSLLYSVAKERPSWLPELFERWLRRRLFLIHQQVTDDTPPKWGDLLDRNDQCSGYFYDAAKSAPELFLKHVLPIVLEVAGLAVRKDERFLPRRDDVWGYLFHNDYESTDSAILNALVTAFESLVKIKPEILPAIVEDLQRRDTFISNYLLLNLLREGAAVFADQAAALLVRQPWRFHCGYSDNRYWVTIQLVQAISPHCSAENLSKLEAEILNFSEDYERTARGHQLFGRSCYALLAAIPVEYRSATAQTRYQELERKFKQPERPPSGMRSFTVISPIKKEGAEKMTNEQWLGAIAKYNTGDRNYDFENPEKGGAWQLAAMLYEFVRLEPERFAKLCLLFPKGTYPDYIRSVLNGLKGAALPDDLKLTVCRKAFSDNQIEYGISITELLGSLKDSLPDDIVGILAWLAREHPDPEQDNWLNKSSTDRSELSQNILTEGINTMRGHVAIAIRDLIAKDTSYIGRFQPTLDYLVCDKCNSVRAVFITVLHVIAPHNAPLALELLGKLVASVDERIFSTEYSERFISYLLRDYFTAVRPYIERILRSSYPEVSEVGARLAARAALFPGEDTTLVQEAMSGGPSQRLGVAEIISYNVSTPEFRSRCESFLLVLFNDEDEEVRRRSASCFRSLHQSDLSSFEVLITRFCDSQAFQEDTFSILHALEDSVERLPGITCVVCEKFLERFSDEARDIRTHHAGDVGTVAKLIFRTYHQHYSDEWAPRCLDLIDRMCLEGIHDARKEMEQFER